MFFDQLLVYWREIIFTTYWCILHTFAFATDDKGYMLKSENLAVYVAVEYF